MSNFCGWRIPSNSGYAAIKFDAKVFHAAHRLIEFRVDLAGRHWYRPGLLADPPEFSNVVDDFDLVLLQVLIPTLACEGLCGDFDNWLASRTPFSRTLCSRPDQELAIHVGGRDGYEATADRPILACTYAGGCGLEVIFTIDQSCVHIAREGLASVLRSFFPDSGGSMETP